MMQILNQNQNFECPIMIHTDISQNLNILNSPIYQTLENPEIINSDNKQIKEPTCPLDKFLPDKTSQYKKTLVLDLDETLIHSNFFNLNSKCDISLDLNIDNKKMKVNVLKRPGVEEFLDKMSNLYEIVIFTASLPQYAIPLIDQLDKKKICNFRLFREHCSFMNNGFTKDLKKLNREMNDIIIVDNNPNSYNLNIDNGFPIKTWLDDVNDRELIKIIPYLEFLSNVNDVRNYIPKMKDGIVFSYDKADLLLEEEKIKKEEEEKERIKREIEKKEREKKIREKEAISNEKLKVKESKEKEMELKKIEELRKKNEEIKRKNKIENEKKMKEIEQNMKEQKEKEKNDRINLVQIIDYTNKNKIIQNENPIYQNNFTFYKTNNYPMPQILLNNTINNTINSNISVQKLNSFRFGNKNFNQSNLFIKKENQTPKILISQKIKTLETPIYSHYNTTSKKAFKLKEKISFDDLKFNLSKNGDLNQEEKVIQPQRLKRHMSLKTSRNIYVLYNPKKKLYLKRDNSPNSNNKLKNNMSLRGRNIIKTFDVNDFENDLNEFKDE